jgi:hypothetical protein
MTDTNLIVREEESADLSPRTYSEMMEFANTVAESGLVPKQYDHNPAACAVAMQWGSELGLKPLQSLQNIAVIGNRPALWGDAVLALVLSSPACKDVIERFEGEGETLTAVCIAQRHGKADKTGTFSIEDAVTASLIGKDVWMKYPKRMLQMRARGFALRDQFPDVLKGLPIAEVVQEVMHDMGAVDEVVRPEAPDTPPPTRMDAVKQRLKKNAPPTLADVLKAIEDAGDAVALTKAGELAMKLKDDRSKEVARVAYADKLHASKTPKPAARTYAEVAEQMSTAQDKDALNVAADLIRHVADETQRNELKDMYSTLAVKFDEPQGE